MKYLATITCILACSALAPAQLAASATFHKAGAPQSHHLFVGVYGGSTPEILRFPFVNGFPATSPDLVYQNVLPPFNVGADGTLYATVPLACCQGLGTVDVFPPNSNQVSRQVTLPNLNEDTTIVTAVAEGPGDYLFVGYSAFISGAKPRGVRNAPKQGVAVYPPDANGGGRPLRMYGARHDISGPNAMAFDREGDLYYSITSAFGQGNRIITVANPTTDPRVIRELTLPLGVDAYGLEFSDDGDELYSLSFTQPPSIAVYPYGAHGKAQPLRSINLPDEIDPGIGIVGRDVYVADYTQREVLAFKKHASGSPPPVYTLSLKGYTSTLALAIGP